MIPNSPMLAETIREISHPGRTYKVEIQKDRIMGYTDDLDAVAQAIYFILGTERYRYVIYSWDYGVELVDLIGKPMPYVMSEVPRRIREALMTDDRITDVVDFEFEKYRNSLHVSFTVTTVAGGIPIEMEVDV